MAMNTVITGAVAGLSTPTVAKPCTGGACLAPSSCVAPRSCPLRLLTWQTSLANHLGSRLLCLWRHVLRAPHPPSLALLMFWRP